MSLYRLYFMDAFHGHIERFEEFDSIDDEAAASSAASSRGRLALELWCSHRKVARFEPLDLATQLLEERRTLKSVKARLEPATSADDTETANRSA